MRKIILTVCLIVACVFAFPGVVPDANTFILGKILSQTISQLKTMQDTYDEIKNVAAFAKATKENIEQIMKMEQDVQTALKTAKNIKDFKFSDVTYLLQKSSGIDLNPEDYIPQTSMTKSLLEKINLRQGSGQSGAALYQLFNQPITIPGTLNLSTSQQTTKTINDQIGIEKMIAAQQGASFEILTNFAERFQEQALELESSVKQEQLFSMNTSERIDLLLKAGNLMEKAVQLRLQANELLKEKPPQTLESLTRASEYIGVIKECSQRTLASRKLSESLLSTN